MIYWSTASTTAWLQQRRIFTSKCSHPASLPSLGPPHDAIPSFKYSISVPNSPARRREQREEEEISHGVFFFCEVIVYGVLLGRSRVSAGLSCVFRIQTTRVHPRCRRRHVMECLLQQAKMARPETDEMMTMELDDVDGLCVLMLVKNDDYERMKRRW